jgi:hypothetical protein
VMQDDSYKKEEIPKWEFLGSFRFDDEEKKSSRNRRWPTPKKKRHYGKKK